VAAPIDQDEDAAYPESSLGDGPKTLGDVQTHLRMSRVGWLIALMIFVAVLAFFIVVVALGVDNS
jgi:hypothetical protein